MKERDWRRLRVTCDTREIVVPLVYLYISEQKVIDIIDGQRRGRRCKVIR